MLRNTTGQASIALLGLVGVVVGPLLWMQCRTLSTGLARQARGMNDEGIAAAVMARAKRLLVTNVAGCGATAARFRAFRDLAAPTPPLRFSENAPVPCLLEPAESAELSRFELRVEELAADPRALSKTIVIALALTGRAPAGAAPRAFATDTRVRLHVPSLGAFNIVFFSTARPLVRLDGGAAATFKGAVLASSTEPPSPDDISGGADADHLIFAKPFFTRASALGAGAAGDDEWRRVFRGGIETGALARPGLERFLPNGSRAWNHGIDYGYVYRGAGNPIPETRGPSATSCAATDERFDAARARLSRLPAPAQGVPSLAATCGGDNTFVPTFVHLGAQRDLTLDLSAADRVFCGVVAARTLVVHLRDPGRYALFGNFFVGRIVIDGPAGSRVDFHNPADNEPAAVPLPQAPFPQDQPNLARQIAAAASGTAYNFFLPLAAAPVFSPRAPADYLVACPDSPVVALAGRYPPLPEIPGFDRLTADPDRGFFFAEEQ